MKTLGAVLLMVSLGFAEDPIKFRGAYIGQPVFDYVDCSSGKGKVLVPGYKAHGKLCEGKRGVIERTKGHGLLEIKEEGEAFMFDESKIVRIMIFVPNNDWEKVRYDLTQKLGEPKSEVPQVFQNNFGARWEVAQGFWQKGDTVAFAKVHVMTVGHEVSTNPLTGRASSSGIEV